jgi:hypothetical protein
MAGAMFLIQEMTAYTERKYDHNNNQTKHNRARVEVHGLPRMRVARRRPSVADKQPGVLIDIAKKGRCEQPFFVSRNTVSYR